MVLLALPPADHLWTNVCARARDAGRRPELRITGAAAQTRMVSVARIRLVSRKSPRLFKGIICDDISEFESHMPSQAVRSLSASGMKGSQSIWAFEPPAGLAVREIACGRPRDRDSWRGRPTPHAVKANQVSRLRRSGHHSARLRHCWVAVPRTTRG